MLLSLNDVTLLKTAERKYELFAEGLSILNESVLEKCPKGASIIQAFGTFYFLCFGFISIRILLLSFLEEIPIVYHHHQN